MNKEPEYPIKCKCGNRNPDNIVFEFKDDDLRIFCNLCKREIIIKTKPKPLFD